jgi:hypothetical protein
MSYLRVGLILFSFQMGLPISDKNKIYRSTGRGKDEMLQIKLQR